MIESAPSLVCGAVVKRVPQEQKVATDGGLPELVMKNGPAATDIISGSTTCMSGHCFTGTAPNNRPALY